MNYIKTILLLLSTQFAYGQDYVFLKEIKTTSTAKISLDHFNNFYIIQDAEITKYNSEAKETYKFTDENLNNNIYFDVSDPFKPLVFNKDFYNLTILDNRLGSINEINLNEVYYGLISVITSSSAQEYWVYDKQDNKLKNLNYNFEVIKESFAFQTIFEKFSEPYKIVIENEKLYTLDKFGIKIFDLFGNYISSYTENGIKDFQIINQQVIFFLNKELKSYKPQTLSTKTLNIPNKISEAKDIKLSNKLLFIVEPKSVKILVKK